MVGFYYFDTPFNVLEIPLIYHTFHWDFQIFKNSCTTVFKTQIIPIRLYSIYIFWMAMQSPPKVPFTSLEATETSVQQHYKRQGFGIDVTCLSKWCEELVSPLLMWPRRPPSLFRAHLSVDDILKIHATRQEPTMLRRKSSSRDDGIPVFLVSLYHNPENCSQIGARYRRQSWTFSVSI